MSFIQWCCEREAKFHVAKEISGRGQRRSRDEKGNQGVGDFRFINILQFFSIYFFFPITLLYHFFFLYFFCPRHLPTPTPTTHDLYPLPTIHDPRHLATLAIYKISYRLRNAACHRFFARTPVAFPSLMSLREAARIPRFGSLLRTCSLIQFISCETTTTWQAASKIESKASGKASNSDFAHHARRFTNISIFCKK